MKPHRGENLILKSDLRLTSLTTVGFSEVNSIAQKVRVTIAFYFLSRRGGK
jgi:hypothetical protein